MTRKYIECRNYPRNWGSECTLEISSDSEEELVEAAVQHAVAMHGASDTPELRDMIRQGMKEVHSHR
jgi:predicted small metal-binding protein